MPTLEIEAPDDVIVSYIAPSGQVKSGQKLASLTSPNLDRMAASLVALQEHIDILLRPFNDGRLDQEIQALSQKAQALQDAFTALTQIEGDVSQSYALGLTDQVHVDQAKQSMLQAQSAKIDADIASSHAQQKKVDLFDKITSAKNRLQRENDYLTSMRGLLQVSAQRSGDFEGVAGQGSFVRKGKLIGTLK